MTDKMLKHFLDTYSEIPDPQQQPAKFKFLLDCFLYTYYKDLIAK